MSRRFTLSLLAAGLVFALAPRGVDAAQTESQHFKIDYGPETTLDYLDLVERGLESAYDLFVVQSSFKTFPGWVDVRVAGQDADTGSEYLNTDDAGNPVPVIEIAPETSMTAFADASVLGLSLQDAVLSATAHEFFHVLQDYASLQGEGTASESAFSEPFATAVQELAAPDADDYVESATPFLLAPDAMSFFDRGYDAALFWVFILDRHGGLDALRQVMQASVQADATLTVDDAFAAQSLTFLDLWADFVLALASGTLPDEPALARLAQAYAADLGTANLTFPPPVAIAHWTGVAEILSRVTETSPASALLGYSDSFPGAALRVHHPYGIEVVAIRPDTALPLALSVSASEATDFRIAVVGRRGTTWEVLSASGRTVVIKDPAHFDEIRVVLTRGETGDGTYTVRLSAAP